MIVEIASVVERTCFATPHIGRKTVGGLCLSYRKRVYFGVRQHIYVRRIRISRKYRIPAGIDRKPCRNRRVGLKMKKRLMALVLCLTVMMTMFAPLANATEEDLLSTPTPTPAPAAATVEPQAESAHESAAPTAAHTEQPSAQPAETVGQPVATAAPAATAVPAETAASPVEEDVSGMIAVTAGSDVNLRTAPGRDSESLGKIAQSGTAVKPLKKVTLPGGEVWYAVEYEGCTGYIFGDLLTLSAAPAAAETPAAAATPETQETPETPAPVITEPDAVYTYEFSNTTSEVIYGYEATATLGQSVSVPRNGRVVLSGPAGQWQILVGGVWADLAGADSGVALTYALLKNAGSSTRIRCLDAAGNSQGESAVTLTDAVSVAAPAQEPVLKKTPLRAAAPAAVANADDETPVADTFVVTIDYKFANGIAAADSWTATIAKGGSLKTTVKSPEVVGYTPDQAEVTLDENDISGNITKTVFYSPANVGFKVEHYRQNLNDNGYELHEEESKDGNTDSAVGEGLEKKYDGFSALLYDATTKVAAAGNTVVKIYYDRNYYLLSLDLDGGYGAEPVYGRYGASISVAIPQRAGYTFVGWSADGGATVVNLPSTMPATYTSYKAVWKVDETAKVTIVFWGENADDEEHSYINSSEVYLQPGTEFTFNENGGLICGQTVHTHSRDCYQLTCTQEEHTHTDSCYTCGQTGHTHGKSCYANVGNVGSPTFAPDNPKNGQIYKYDGIIVHASYIYINGTWYKYTGNLSNGSIAQPICGKTEGAHTHTDACLGCGKAEHTHSVANGCYTLTCTQVEHQHNDACYGTKPSELDATKWEFDRSDTVTVAADGSTVVNVYYNRKEYSVRFYNNNENEYVQLRIIAKWGANISDKWPTYNGSSTWSTSANGSTYQVNMQTMPVGGAKFYGPKTANNSESAYYYVEVLPGETGDTVNNGTTYKLHHKDTSPGTGYSVTEEDKYEIPGFTYKEGTSNESSYNNAKFYYSRNSYYLVFNNGAENVKTESVKYEAPLAGYANFTPEAPDRYEEGSVRFDGWYLNPECTGEKYELSGKTMPADNVLLFAKWVPVTRKVTTWLTSEKTIPVNIGESNEQTIDHGKTAIEPEEPTNGNYTFVGWFYTEDGVEKPFNFSMPVTKDLELYAKWSTNAMIRFIIHYVDEHGNKIADDYEGQALAGTTQTFDAKLGNDLYEGYREGYYPMVSSSNLDMDINQDTVEYTFVYVSKPSMPYIVRYLEKGTETVLHEQKREDTKSAIVTEKFVVVSNYRPDAYQKQLVITADEAKNVITFWYEQDTTHAPLHVVHWVQNIEGDGYTLYSERTDLNAVVGAGVTEEPLSIDGFTYNPDKSTNTGVVEAGSGLELNLYYDRNTYPYLFRFVDRATGNEMGEDTAVSGVARYQAQVTEKAKQFPGYTCVSGDQQTISIAIESPATDKNLRIFYYEETQVTIHYVAVTEDGGSVSLSDETIGVLTGDPNGSAPTAKTGYVFVGWYTDEECAISVNPEWVDSLTGKIVPKQSVNLGTSATPIMVYAGATYYAKFVKLVNVTVTKEVTGNLGDKSKEFAFTASWVNAFGQLKSESFNLAHGNYKILTSIPVGANVTITEADYSDSNYTTSYKVNAGDAQNGCTAQITVSEEGDAITFTNNKEATPDTGVLLDSLPYVVILAVVVLGAALVIVRRRKHRDDD